MTTDLVPFVQPSSSGQPLEFEDYYKLKQSCVEGKSTDTRNLLLVQLYFGTGLRLSEVMNLTPEHVQQNGPDVSIWIQRGKRQLVKGPQDKYEAVPLGRMLGASLLDYARGNQVGRNKQIFQMTPRRVQQILAELGIRALGRSVNSRDFRKLYIRFLLLERGLPIEVVAKMVGHTNTATTMKYYFDLTQEQRKEINQSIPV